MRNFYEVETGDEYVIRGDTLNIKKQFVDKNGSHINDIALQGWLCTFTLRDPITDEPIIWRLNEEKSIAADFTTDNFTCSNHGFDDNDIVQVNSDDTLPVPLTANTDYYIIVVDANTFQLSATPSGPAIDITDNGTGNHYAAMNVKLQKTHNDVAPAGDGIYYNNDINTIAGIGITRDNQIVVVLTYKETSALEPDIYPFDIQFKINQAYKSSWTIKGHLIVESEVTKSV